jgi:hypothetical protein
MKLSRQLSKEEKQEIITDVLINLAKKKRTVSIKTFCNMLKEEELFFSIIPGQRYGIYFYLGEISVKCKGLQAPILTTLIEFKTGIKPFYDILDKSKCKNNEEVKELYANYPKEMGRKILEEERLKVFNFNWKDIMLLT